MSVSAISYYAFALTPAGLSKRLLNEVIHSVAVSTSHMELI